jgi:hypothetical protein
MSDNLNSFSTNSEFRIGSFMALHNVIHPRAVTEFIYRYSSPAIAHIFISFKLDGKGTDRQAEVKAVLDQLAREDMAGFDISDDELAKSHARYMVGGRREVPNERVFRFRESTISSHAKLMRLCLMLVQSSRNAQARCGNSFLVCATTGTSRFSTTGITAEVCGFVFSAPRMY